MDRISEGAIAAVKQAWQKIHEERKKHFEAIKRRRVEDIVVPEWQRQYDEIMRERRRQGVAQLNRSEVRNGDVE